MHRWPLWGLAKDKKRAVAFALLQMYCETRSEGMVGCRRE
jgi:hypothetical protein